MIDLAAALALHEQFPPIDLHADTLMWARHLGYDMSRRHTPPLPKAAWGGHVDLPRMREGRMGGQFLGLVALPIVHRDPYSVVCEQIDILDAVVARETLVRKARSSKDFECCEREGCVALSLGLEGAHALMGDHEKLAALASRGVKYLGLSHFSSNAAAHPAYGFGRDDSQGLSKFGEDLIGQCEQLGVIVDLAHTNRRCFMQACELATKPPIVSHTGLSSVFGHWRNIDDEQVRAVAECGGVIGVIFAPRFLGTDGVGGVVAHLRHLIEIGGEDCAALGSDWDGMVVPSTGLREACELPTLTMGLLASGLRSELVGKVLRGNVMRVLAAHDDRIGGATACAERMH